MTVKLKNNAVTTLSGTITADDVGIPVAGNTATIFPTLGTDEYFYATVIDANGASEIVKVTEIYGDSLAAVRAQENTTARGFPAGSRIEMRVTAQSVLDAAADQVSVTATLNVIGSSDTTAGLPGTAEIGDAWVIGYSDSTARSVYMWSGTAWFLAFDFIAPQGPRGFRGLQGIQGLQGVQGPQGTQGVKGDVGNFYGITMIGASSDLGDRPVSATAGDFWGLLSGETIRLYIYTGSVWADAGSITSPTAYPVANTIYVQEYGNDANSGTSWGTAVRTIEQALVLATARAAPTLIEWGAESPVLTEGHLDMPDNTVIRAAHRSVVIRPAPGFEERNVFRMGSGCFLEGMLFENFRLDSLTNPTEGFAVSFRPGAIINRAPYAHKIAVRTVPAWGLVPPPLDRDNANPEVGIGGGVVLADGLVCSQYSRFANIMTWGATPVTHNGIGYCAKNGGLINAVNAVSMWAHKHFLALSGGQIVLSSCSTQFGDYSLYASGSRSIVVPTAVAGGTLAINTAAATAVTTAATTLIDDMWTYIDTTVDPGTGQVYTFGWTATDETYTRSDAALLLQCLAWTLKTANEQPMLDFAKGLFDVAGTRVYDAGKQVAFIAAFEKLRDDIIALAGVNAAGDAIVTALIAALVATITTPATQVEPSRITAVGHTWTATMAGVALTKIPPANNATPIADSIVEVSDGVVIASGQDDQGNALFVGGLTIQVDTGELGGPPFESAVRRIATRAAISRSY